LRALYAQETERCRSQGMLRLVNEFHPGGSNR
jgi:hypothetical protein